MNISIWSIHTFPAWSFVTNLRSGSDEYRKSGASAGSASPPDSDHPWGCLHTRPTTNAISARILDGWLHSAGKYVWLIYCDKCDMFFWRLWKDSVSPKPVGETPLCMLAILTFRVLGGWYLPPSWTGASLLSHRQGAVLGGQTAIQWWGAGLISWAPQGPRCPLGLGSTGFLHQPLPRLRVEHRWEATLQQLTNPADHPSKVKIRLLSWLALH